MTHGVHLIAKAPLPNWCNTRLAASIGAERAAKLQEHLLDDHLEFLRTVDAPHCLWIGIPGDAQKEEVQLKYPSGQIVESALGLVLERALQTGREKFGWDYAFFMGVDSPEAIFAQFTKSRNLVVEKKAILGPTQDGGVYLIGIPEQWQEPFREIAWGTPSVFQHLSTAAQRNGVPVHILPIGRDVDTVDDFLVLKESLRQNEKAAPRTAKWLSLWE